MQPLLLVTDHAIDGALSKINPLDGASVVLCTAGGNLADAFQMGVRRLVRDYEVVAAGTPFGEQINEFLPKE